MDMINTESQLGWEAWTRFLRDYGSEESFYYVVWDLSKKSKFELRWFPKKQLWYVRLYRSGAWSCFSEKNGMRGLKLFLSRHRLDKQMIRDQLEDSCLSQAVWAQMTLAKAKKFLGSEAVETAVREHAHFGESLKEMVDELTAGTDKASTQDQDHRRGHLTLI